MDHIPIVGYVNEKTRAEMAEFFYELSDVEQYGVLCDNHLSESGKEELPYVYELELAVYEEQTEQYPSKVELTLNPAEDTIEKHPDYSLVKLRFVYDDLK